jgi:enoyl-CoA hydratase/carnithine racemase|tara:strand:- start:3307 stop:4131 length:825 start_codon:yes stop_codon:yes gene_type:complete
MPPHAAPLFATPPQSQATVLLQTRRDDGVATLTLNRPKQYNALSEELLVALTSALQDLAQDDSLRAVVLAANGPAFCAGHDLKQMRATPHKAYYQRLFATCSRMMLSILTLPVPVIAKVQGLATAAGCQLVGTCDLAVAQETARFGTSGINTGLFCSTPAVALTRNVAAKPAFEMLMTGDFIDAEEAQALGLINRVAEDDSLDDTVELLLQKILSKSAAAVRTGKALFYKQLEVGVVPAYEMAAEAMACNMMADDAGEGIDAFIEKRPAVWRHR